jgi:hypothetical protein
MRTIKRIPPADETLRSELIAGGWTRLKEPANLLSAALFSMPFMFINGAISLAIALLLYPPLREFFSSETGFSISIGINISTLLFLLAVPLFTAMHEFIHALFIPNVRRSEKTFWGMNGAFGFVYTEEKIRKERFLLISVMPFLLLSILLPFLLRCAGWLNGYTIVLCLINAMGSSVDILNAGLVAIQVPGKAYIVNNGPETYFREDPG